MEKLLLKPEEVVQATGICRAKVYKMMQSGELPGVCKVGRSVRISAKALQTWVDKQTEAAACERV